MTGFIWRDTLDSMGGETRPSETKGVLMSATGKRLTIIVEPKDDGFVCVAANGDLPFEGRIHPTKEAAMNDLDAAYDNVTWHGTRHTDIAYSIEVD